MSSSSWANRECSRPGVPLSLWAGWHPLGSTHTDGIRQSNQVALVDCPNVIGWDGLNQKWKFDNRESRLGAFVTRSCSFSGDCLWEESSLGLQVTPDDLDGSRPKKTSFFNANENPLSIGTDLGLALTLAGKTKSPPSAVKQSHTRKRASVWVKSTATA